MNNCEICTKKPDPVPYAVHEADMARMERTVKRLWILLLVLIVLFVGSNLAWVYYEKQLEVVQETEIEQDTDGGGNNYVIGGDFNGTAKDKSDEAQNP